MHCCQCSRGIATSTLVLQITSHMTSLPFDFCLCGPSQKGVAPEQPCTHSALHLTDTNETYEYTVNVTSAGVPTLTQRDPWLTKISKTHWEGRAAEHRCCKSKVLGRSNGYWIRSRSSLDIVSSLCRTYRAWSLSVRGPERPPDPLLHGACCGKLEAAYRLL